MKVLMLMLSDSPGIGGLEKHTRELALGLAENGVTVTLVSAQQHLAELPPDVRTVATETTRSRHSPILLLRMLRLIWSEHFDLVHAQGTKAAFVLERLSPLLRRCRRIATIHGFKSRYPSARAFDRMIAVSHTLAESIGQSGIAVVYNGIKLSSPVPARLPRLENPIWLAVGRLAPVKGFQQLIEAFRHCPGNLLIAGDGPQKEELQSLIDDTQQQNRIRLLGYRDDIPELMLSADGIIISSEREGFSYVCAEALLLGKPVISTNVPIANELLPKEYLVDLTKPETLLACLQTPPANMAAAQHAAQSVAARELTLSAMIKNTLNLYEEVMHDKR